MAKDIRNVAIIAHVDHGKTTLVDCLLHQSGMLRDNAQLGVRIMDSNDLERERGITILAKNTSVTHKGVKINIVDTPGHADFGGEVERVLNMVDAALLVVDAVDGPMPQTRFVLGKALELGLKPIIVVNKVDRPDARSTEVLNEVFDLCIELGADDEQADFEVVYASARDGWASNDPDTVGSDVIPLLDLIVRACPPPSGDAQEPLKLLVAALDYDPYVGRLAIGRIANGRLETGGEVALVRLDGTLKRARVQKLITFEGLERAETTTAEAGEIVAVAGLEEFSIGETIACTEQPEGLPAIAVEHPTLAMHFQVNDSPFAGREGKYVTSRQLEERLIRELRTNVALRVEATGSADTFKVSGRGELHLSVLVETMRREGFEFALSRPEVVSRLTADGQLEEPVEQVVIDVDDIHMGRVIELTSERGAEMVDLHHDGSGRARVELHIPTKGLIGFRSQFLTETRGTGILHSMFLEYRPARGEAIARQRGVLIAKEPGETTAYALESLEDRGILYLPPGSAVYGGQIVGLHSRDNDIVVNPCKKKHLTNMRASTSDIEVKLTPPTVLSLEQAINFVDEDELVEVTPKSLRLRKKVLNHSRRRVVESRAKKIATATVA